MQSRFWLVCYDISNDKSRRHLAELLLEIGGARVQKSVFELALTPAELESAKNRIDAIRDQFSDKLLYAPLCSVCRARVLWQGKGLHAASQAYWVV
jgi:CRISPR-associated protein Cas2